MSIGEHKRKVMAAWESSECISNLLQTGLFTACTNSPKRWQHAATGVSYLSASHLDRLDIPALRVFDARAERLVLQRYSSGCIAHETRAPAGRA